MNPGEIVLREIVGNLQDELSQSGIMYRIFSRVKTTSSIKMKMEKKLEKYKRDNKKLQDMLALRITLYFTDDVEIVHTYLKSRPNYIDESVDERDTETFKPVRLNLVMRVPGTLSPHMQTAVSETDYSDLIDDTYEIQIRTILSEGWHEVEHDLRYKYKDDWVDFLEESRLLNGILASLENDEWAMISLFDRLAYAHYKRNEWDSMLRNKMRIHFASAKLSDDVKSFLTEHIEVAKQLFRANRAVMLGKVLEKGFSFPLTYDTTLHLLNHICVKNIELAKKEDPILKEELDKSYGIINMISKC